MKTYARLTILNDGVKTAVRRSVYVSLAVMLALLATSPANASVMTYDVTFSAVNFSTGVGVDSAPVDPVVGSFEITFDPALDYTNATAGITLNSLNIALGSAISFNYHPGADGGFPAGTLRVGGIQVDTDTVDFAPSTNDFWLHIEGFLSTPVVEQLGYSQTSVSSANLFYTLPENEGDNSVTVTQVVNPVPEPATLVVWSLLAAFGIAFGWNRRRRAA